MSEAEQLDLSDITVVSVCFRSDAVIGGMVRSIPEHSPIILVDNGGTNNFNTVPADRNVTIIRLENNIGFGRGCNAGAAQAKTPWLLFLNPDARLERHSLEALLEAVRKYHQASAFNPRISHGNGREYFKRRSYLLRKPEYMKSGWPDGDCTVPVLSGAAILISKKIFESVGGFDQNIFLYHEDDDLSIRLRELGPLMFVRNALVIHANGHSSGRSAEVAHFKAFHMAQSRIYAGRKHGRPYPAFFALAQGIAHLILASLFFSRRRWAKARGFLSGVCASIGNC